MLEDGGHLGRNEIRIGVIRLENEFDRPQERFAQSAPAETHMPQSHYTALENEGPFQVIGVKSRGRVHTSEAEVVEHDYRDRLPAVAVFEQENQRADSLHRLVFYILKVGLPSFQFVGLECRG